MPTHYWQKNTDKVCSGCQQRIEKKSFSCAQWRKNDGKCKTCVVPKPVLPRKKKAKTAHPADMVYLRNHMRFVPSPLHPWHTFVLAMHLTFKRDKVRLQALRILTDATITTVSSHNEGLSFNGFEHLSSDFGKWPRGMETLVNGIGGVKGIKDKCEERKTVYKVIMECSALPIAIATLVASFMPTKITVLLDYFWLEKNYYKSNYGMFWLKHHAHALFMAGADEIMLPWDCRHEVNVPSNMDEMVSDADSRLVVQPIQPESNWLWVATEAVSNINLSWDETPWAHERMTVRLNDKTPFLKITRGNMFDPALVRRVIAEKIVRLGTLENVQLTNMLSLTKKLESLDTVENWIANGSVRRFHIQVR